MMLAVIFAQAAVKTDRKQRWMVCKLMSDSGADDGKVFNQGSNAKTTNPLINCWTHNKMDKLKRLFFLSELASFRTTCSSLWLMLLSNCHNSLYKGENLLAQVHLIWLFSWGRLNQSIHWARSLRFVRDLQSWSFWGSCHRTWKITTERS